MVITALPARDGDPLAPAPTPIRTASPEARAPGVLDQRRRVQLADRIDDLVDDAIRHHGVGERPSCARREQVVAARGRLHDLEHALRSGIPITRHGEHLTEGLLDAAEAGAYAIGDPRALHDDAELACRAMGSVTPFH